MATAEGRARAQYDAKPLLQALPAGALRMQIVRELARVTQVEPEELTVFAGLQATQAPGRNPRGGERGGWRGDEGGDFRGGRGGSWGDSRRPAPPRIKRAPPAPLEARVLQLLLGFPPLAQILSDEERFFLEGLEALDPVAMRELLAACAGASAEAGSAGVAEVLAHGPAADYFEDALRQLMLAPAPIIAVEEAERELKAAIAGLRLRAAQRERERLAAAGLADPAAAARFRELLRDEARLRALAEAVRVHTG